MSLAEEIEQPALLDDELSIRVDSRIEVDLVIDHDHDDGLRYPMVEQAHRAEHDGDASARVYYRCPECGCTASLQASARPGPPPEVSLHQA
jgi:hypothetical protein